MNLKTQCPFYLVRHLSRDNPGDPGFLCNKPSVLRDNTKGKLYTMNMIRYGTGQEARSMKPEA
jgi:hypothetical protein